MRALREESEDAEIPMTSLIDIIFLLLIFFLVTTTFARQELDQQVELPHSEAATSPVDVPERMVVNVREDGSLIVNGCLRTEDELRAELRTWRTAHPDSRAAIRGDGRTPYQAVMRVFGMCRAEGVTRVDLPVLDPGHGDA